VNARTLSEIAVMMIRYIRKLNSELRLGSVVSEANSEEVSLAIKRHDEADSEEASPAIRRHDEVDSEEASPAIKRHEELKRILKACSKRSATSDNTAFTLREDHPRSARSIFRGVEAADNPALAKSPTRRTDRCA